MITEILENTVNTARIQKFRVTCKEIKRSLETPYQRDCEDYLMFFNNIYQNIAGFPVLITKSSEYLYYHETMTSRASGTMRDEGH